MKICKRCGTPQNDTRFFCIDCGRPLGKLAHSAWMYF